MEGKTLEIFFGTGGVGKTTLSSSRAIYLAQQGKKVLLITIDPAKRLKDVLSLDESLVGEKQRVHGNFFEENEKYKPHLDAILISPMKTLQRVIKEHTGNGEVDNRILKILFRPNGGMNEIMSLLEVHHYLRTKDYDSIVLDTPPGKHFIEFLESCQKIRNFFDQNFIEIFNFLTTSETRQFEDNQDQMNKKRFIRPVSKVFKKFVSTGLNKLLEYLEKFTGSTFVEEFIRAVEVIYKLKIPFLRTLDLQSQLKDPTFCNWYLVTSIEHDKILAAVDLKDSVEEFFIETSYLAINKCLEKYWDEWSEESKPDEKHDPFLLNLKKSMVMKERKIKALAKSNFKNVLEFDEVLSSSVSVHVSNLSSQWKKFKY